MAEIRSNAASVEFRNVTKIYGKSKTPAVNDISLFIEAGKLVTLLGPSGCGKTTTLRMIAGLEMATAGQILIGGADVTRLPATDRDVSMVFQSYALFPHMTVSENVEYGLHFSGFAKKEVGDRGQGRARARRPLRLRRPAAQPAFRRPAAARRRRPRAGARAAGAALRRAALQPRRETPPPCARGDPRDPAEARPDRRLCHARPGGGARGVGPHHRHEQRRHRAGRHAARALRCAGQRLRRRLHRRGQHLRLRDRRDRERHRIRAARRAHSVAAGARLPARPGQARGAAKPHRASSGRNAEHAARRRWRRRPMSAATSNSSSARNSARSSWCHRTSMHPFEPGQPVGIGFPARGPVLIRVKADSVRRPSCKARVSRRTPPLRR